MTSSDYRLDRPRVVGVGSPKGGVGKSTLAVHLSTFAEQAGYRTLLMDADVNLTSYDWVMRTGDLLPISVDRQLSADVLMRLHEIRDFDVILVDLPGARETEAWTALLRGGDTAGRLGLDALVVPSKVETADLRVVVRFLQEVILPSKLPYLLVGTMIRTQSVHVALQALNELAADGLAVARTPIRDLVVHSDAVTANRPITAMPGGRHSNARRAEAEYRAVAREVFAGLLSLPWPSSDETDR